MASYREITFSDDDVVNVDDWVPRWETDGSLVRPWMLSDGGVVVAVMFAESYTDALDIAADSGKLAFWRIDADGMADYRDGEGIDYLGSDCVPYDLGTLDVGQLPNPEISWCALFDHMMAEVNK